MNVTVPVGVPPATTDDTVALNVTDWPNTSEAIDDVSVVVVGVRVLVSEKEAGLSSPMAAAMTV